jgi:hypothetical protein
LIATSQIAEKSPHQQQSKEYIMRMDLIAGLSYKKKAWRRLIQLLESWEVSTHEFSLCNDGKLISRNTCLAVAWAIEANLEFLDECEREWLEPHIELWRYSGGLVQW